MGANFAFPFKEYMSDTSPNVAEPPHYDPMAGFPKGRKKRVCNVTWEEMDKYDVPLDFRDYCVDKYIS